MKKSEVIEKLKSGEVQIHNDKKNLKLLRELLQTAFPSDICITKGESTYYAKSYNNLGKWRSSDLLNTPYTEELVKLSEVIEDETFTKGELVEVRDNDTSAWVKREFIIEYKGLFICMTVCGDGVSYWKQIRKINPLQKEIDALKESAEKQGITVNIFLEKEKV